MHIKVGVTFIAGVLVLGGWACAKLTSAERSARPLGFTSGAGSIEGNQLVFIDVDEPAAAIGTAAGDATAREPR